MGIMAIFLMKNFVTLKKVLTFASQKSIRHMTP